MKEGSMRTGDIGHLVSVHEGTCSGPVVGAVVTISDHEGRSISRRITLHTFKMDDFSD